MSDENRIDGWRKDPASGRFDDLKKENFAKARAKGSSIAASAGYAGISNATGSKWEREAPMKMRISELRAGAEDFVGVSKGWILEQMKDLVSEARESGQLSTAAKTLEVMYEIVNTDKDLAGNMARAMAPGATTAEIRKQFLQTRQQLPAPSDAPSLTDVLDADGEEVEVH